MYLHGLGEMIGYALGWPAMDVWWIPFTVALVVLARIARVDRFAFYSLFIVAFPVMLAALQSGNVGYPRYYLVAGVGLLLLVGEMVTIGIECGGWRRAVAVIGGVAILAGSFLQNLALVHDQRGDPAAAVFRIRALSPDGATLSLDRASAVAVMEVAAAQQGFALRLQLSSCPPTRFALADRFKREQLPTVVSECGATYHAIDKRQARGLSGTDWQLYERAEKP
jgi:hypothetical protein